MAFETGTPSRLVGRRAECQALDRLVREALAGQSRVVVLRGEAGIGKSALLRHVSEQAGGWHVARAEGVQSEMELAYSGLHQLCAPMLGHLDRLPVPQHDALATVFGRSTAPAPEPFLVGLATLTLLAEFAERHPLLCIVDDAQWLDGASAQILGFVGRRLVAERVALVCAARAGVGDSVLTGLPELSLHGLGDSDARALLLASVYGPLDAAVCEQIILESHGNPLALLELPRSWNVGDLAGGFGLPAGQPVGGKIEQSYAERLRLLPTETQLLVLAAAAEPLGDPVLLHRAAGALGTDLAASDPAQDAGLLRVGGRVEFAHPLVRSASYRAATAEDRHRVHRALAEATDAARDPDRRAWHRARATAEPDDEVAAELERSAGRAQARGGLAAAAAFLQQSTALTQSSERRAGRAIAAAQASLQVGAFDAALGLLATAEAGLSDELQRAQVELLRGRIAAATNAGSEAPAELLKAARRLERLDVTLARGTYLDAWGAALFAGRLAHADANLLAVSQAARAAPRPRGAPSACDLLLDGLAALVTDGRAAAAPALTPAVRAFRGDEVSIEQWLQWGVLASSAAVALWDFESWDAVSTRQIELARSAGALTLLSVALNGQGMIATWRGEFEAAASLTAEDDALKEATGVRIAPYGAMLLAAYQGRTAEASRLTDATIADAENRGEGLGIDLARWTTAILHNGLGRYEEALVAAEQAGEDTPRLFISAWALPELIEAAVKSGQNQIAADALTRFGEATDAGDAEWAAGIQARSRALVSEDEAAERFYRDGIERLGRTQLRPELGRAHLLYGEWLRRESRRLDAREQLTAAHDLFGAVGMEAFAERARLELVATGMKVRTRTNQVGDDLTRQEEQIARLARDGLSNPEIGARLFISPRTVEWHLRKVFTKLGISSRGELRAALRTSERDAALL
jgi:DNA-binding CsgD family transcriptional regulator